MPTKAKSDFRSKEWQVKAWNKVVSAAGPRYTKEFNVDLPIAKLFDGLTRNDEYFQRIHEFNKKISKESSFIKRSKEEYSGNPIIRDRLRHLAGISRAACTWLLKMDGDRAKRTYDFEKVSKILRTARPDKDPFYDYLREEERRDYDQWEEKNPNNEGQGRAGYYASEEVRKLQALDKDIRELAYSLESLEYFLKQNISKLVNLPFLLILGRAGIGKTHLLCDIAKQRIKNDKPTYIVLGEELLSFTEPLSAITRSLHLQIGNEDFLSQLNKIGEKQKERVLLIIDAINEGDKVRWKKTINAFIKRISKYPWIGVVFSCRIPFENISVPKRAKLIREQHIGFQELELEAMRIFFKYYKLPLPEVPLLVQEFSNPLFLGSFCKTAQEMKDGKRAVTKKLKELAIGQNGMTTILEDFYRAKQRLIFKKYAKSVAFKNILHDGWLWKNGDCISKLLAQSMAQKRENYLTEQEVANVIGSYFKISSKFKAKKFLKILIEFGVLIEDLTWDAATKTYYKIVKFSFHKFSDHLIARYLLEAYLIPSKARISIKEDTYLGTLFKDESSINKHADLVEAIFVEFPERLKSLAKYQDKDLIDYIEPKLAQSSIVREIYIRSLYWRHPENFFNASHQLKKSIKKYLNTVILRYRPSTLEFLELLVTTSIKPLHALNAHRLDSFLKSFPLPQRDLFWSEFIRKQDQSGSVYRLVDWIEHGEVKTIDPDQADACILTLSWCLTTTSHLLRDRVTRCIYMLGRMQPKICFKNTLRSLSCDDPYISERMMAASYGVSMAVRRERNCKDLLKSFSTAIYENFFKKKAQHATTHVLMREYARSIIELSLYERLLVLKAQDIKRIRPPYSEGGIRRWGRDSDKDKNKYRDGNSPLGMDFENYSIGRLVKGRNNYDFENKEFVKVKENILWRIYQLGYTLEAFGNIDKEIVRSKDYYGHEEELKRVDRYGKKYSWIAYYEMVGYRLDGKLLETYSFDEDGRGEEDLDPAFPIFANDFATINEDFLSNSKKLKPWLASKSKPQIKKHLIIEELKQVPGPWVLVQGTIAQVDTDKERKISLFIENFLASKNDLPLIKEALNSTEHPGNNSVPQLPDLRNLYSGEIDWRESYFKKELFDTVKIQKIIGQKKFKNKVRILWYGESSPIVQPPQYYTRPIYQNAAVKVLTRYFHTKNYRSPDYDSIGLYIPNARVVKILNLQSRPDTLDMYCADGTLATVSISSGGPYKTHQNLLYIRKDLLKKLEERYKKFFHWYIWGEKNFWPEDMSNFHRADLQKIYQGHKNIHRQFLSL
jgi:hypothetical protein